MCSMQTNRLHVIITILLMFGTCNMCLYGLEHDITDKTKDPVLVLNAFNNDAKNKETPKLSIPQKIGKAFGAVTEFFMGCDTNYITPQLYQFTTQAELSYWHDYYHLRSSITGNSMVIESDPSFVLGGYIYWGFLGYGHSVNIQDIGKPEGEHNGTARRNSFVFNTGRLFAEIFTFNSGKTAQIKRMTDYDFKDKDRSFSGLSSKCFGLSAHYIFNHRRYSWPAAFGENAVQRISCGSWKLGFSYNHQKISFNKKELPDYLIQDIDSTLLFNHVDYKDYAVSFGYGYNWVFRKNCLLAVSVLPSIGYRKSNIEESYDEKSILKNISTDLIFRASLVWNNTKYFSGLELEAHTYSYRKKKFGLTNTYGTLKFTFGFNFLKK